MTDQILKLSAKKLSGQASDEELRQLEALLAKDPDAAAILDTMLEQPPESDSTSDEDGRRLWKKTLAKIKKFKVN